MKVLVTGNRGYIGSVLAPQLARDGHTVSGLDTCLYAGCDFGPERGEIPTVRADVRDVGADDLAGFDAVVHLAALSNDPIGELRPELTFQINLEGTLRVARAAKEAGVRRFLFASSCSMYGASGSDDLLDEDAPLRPLTAYAESKVRAEEGLLELAGSDFCPVAMRNATVYGLSPRLRLDVVLNNLAGWAHTTGRIRLLSDGTAWRPLLHVEDLAATALALLDADEAAVRGEAFNVGTSEQNYLVRELAETLAEVTGCEIELADEATADPRSYRVDFGKLERAFPALRLGWTARRGAEELTRGFAEHGMTRELFDGPLYVRLRRVRQLIDGNELDDDLRWTSR